MDKIQDLKTVLDKSVGDVLTANFIDKVFKKIKLKFFGHFVIWGNILVSSNDQTQQCYNPKKQPNVLVSWNATRSANNMPAFSSSLFLTTICEFST